MAESPLFRVGDDVELWRMLLNFTVLALVVMAFEKALHVLEKRVEQYPKYHQMITKVYRELMILGILGLGIKMLKEAGLVDDDSNEMVAFVSADLTIFFLAVALILQAITIFLQLRLKNKQMDNLELIGSEDLLALAVAHERRRKIQGVVQRVWSTGKYDEEVRIRIFRSLFLRMHKLPEIFPFAKYLRQAQDNQITHMIDIELSMWLLVFLVAWSVNASINVLGKSMLFGTDEDDENNKRRTSASDSVDAKTREQLSDAKSHYALAVVFAIYSWMLLLFHLVTLHVFERFLDKLLHKAGVNGKTTLLERLHQVAIEEATNLSSEVTAHAIQRMEDVLEEEQVKQHKRHHHLIAHDQGFQLMAICYRNIKSPSKKRAGHDDHPPAPAASVHDDPAALEDEVKLRGFSRKAWHFTLKAFLILNGLYIALFVQTMVSHMTSFTTAIGILPTLLIPLPLVVNWFVQTDLMRKFILVSSLSKVHVDTLSDVIRDFTETVQLQNSFISSVLGCLEGHGQSILELEQLFEARDIMESGWIDIEDMRQILSAALGFQMSFFRFNSVMQLLFQLKHLKVDYRKVVTLLTLASEQHAEGGHDGPHTMSVVALHDLDHHHPHLYSHSHENHHDHHDHHHEGLLHHPEHYSDKASFVIMEGGRGFSFASSTAIPQDGLHRPSKLTRQMMGATSTANTTRNSSMRATTTTTANSSNVRRRWGSSFHLRQPSLAVIAGSGGTSVSGSTPLSAPGGMRTNAPGGGGADSDEMAFRSLTTTNAHSHFLAATLPDPSAAVTPLPSTTSGYEASTTPNNNGGDTNHNNNNSSSNRDGSDPEGKSSRFRNM